MQPSPLPTFQGPGRVDDAARLQIQRYRAWQRQGGLARKHRITLSSIDAVLIACLSLCLLAIGLGLDRMYPVVRPSLDHALHEDLPRRPFPDCEAAHAAGIFSIPRGSPAYAVEQDGNGNGLACEPG
jgi:hypothetical protein